VHRRGASAYRRPDSAGSSSSGPTPTTDAVMIVRPTSSGSTPRTALKMHTSHIGMGLPMPPMPPVPPLKVPHFQGSPRVSPRGVGQQVLASPRLGHVPSSPLRRRPYVASPSPLPPRAPSPLQPSVFRVSTPSCSPRLSSSAMLPGTRIGRHSTVDPVDGSLSPSSSSTSMSSLSSAVSPTSSTERLLPPEAAGVQLPRSILKTGSSSV
jgi:hypothetical protein